MPNARQTARFIRKLARAQERIYFLLKPHDDHDLEVVLGANYSPVYAHCHTCNIVLLDLGATDDPIEKPSAPNPNLSPA